MKIRFPVVLGMLLLGAGCIDSLYTIEKKASCAGVTVVGVRAALASDPAIEITGHYEKQNCVIFHCRRNGNTAAVAFVSDPPGLGIAVNDSSKPDAGERIAWLAEIDYLCDRLDAAFPGLGPWELHESPETPWWGWLVSVGFLLALVALGVFGIFRFTVWQANRPTRSYPPA